MLKFQQTAAQAAAGLFILALATAPAVAADVQSRLQDIWRTQIAKSPGAAGGCSTVEYPSTTWVKVPCVKAPARPFIHSHPLGSVHSDVAGAGAGNDYTEVGNGPVVEADGDFSAVKGLTSEKDGGVANIYSLQMNSQFFATDACSGATDPTQCQGWAQFLYSSGEQTAFIQYWLIGYGNTCPTTPYNDWNQSGGNCFRNSDAVSVSQLPITALSTMRIRGFAETKSGKDTVEFDVGTKAYRAENGDNAVDLGTNWRSTEGNVFGDADSSEGVFNKG